MKISTEPDPGAQALTIAPAAPTDLELLLPMIEQYWRFEAIEGFDASRMRKLLTRVLEENFVVTMEPGLYFIDQLLEHARGDHRGAKINWARVDQFRRFGGIRIEDNLAITAGGCENLTRDAFANVTGVGIAAP